MRNPTRMLRRSQLQGEIPRSVKSLPEGFNRSRRMLRYILSRRTSSGGMRDVELQKTPVQPVESYYNVGSGLRYLTRRMLRCGKNLGVAQVAPTLP